MKPETSRKSGLLRHITPYLSIVLLLLTAWATYAEWHGLSRMHFVHYDFSFFYYAFGVIFHHQDAALLYQPQAQHSLLTRLHFPLIANNQYVYPPQFALVWAWLGGLPFLESAAAWLAISVLAFGFGIYWAARVLWPNLSMAHWFWLVLAAALLTPFQFDLAVGNVNTLLFSCIALTFYLLYVRRSPWFAGIPLGLAILFKVTPGAVLVYLAMRRQWRACVSTVVTCAIVTGWSALVLGPDCLWRYALHFFSFGKTSMKNGPAPFNQSIVGVLQDLAQHHWFHLSHRVQTALLLAFILAVVIAIAFVLRRTQANPAIDMALASMLPMLFSPLIEQAHVVLAMPALLTVAKLAWNRLWHPRAKLSLTTFWLCLTAAASYLLLSLPATFGINAVVHWFPGLFWLHTQMFWVIVALFGVVVWRSAHPPLEAQAKMALHRRKPA